MQLILLHTNDTHGHLNPIPTESGQSLGGYARRATFINQQRAVHKHVLLMDAGDFYQSSRYWHAFRGEPDIDLMNRLEYDVAALGNHDFDGGLDLLAQRIRQARFPLLCANMAPSSGHELDGLWHPYIIKEIERFRIGIFSLLVDDRPLYPPEFERFITCHAIQDTARTMVKQLRSATDMLICLSHLGHDLDLAIAEEIDGIDLIIGGHTHTPLQEIFWESGTPIVRSMVGSQFVGRTVVELERNAQPQISDYRLVPLDDSFADEPMITNEIQRWTMQLPPERNLGQLLTSINTSQEEKASGESAAGNLYVDALLAQSGHDAQLAFVHMGTLRGDRAYGPGDFTNLDLSEYHPFPNAPITRRLNGRQLKLLLEWGASALPMASARYVSFAGLTVYVDLSRQPKQIDPSNEQILIHGYRVIKIKYQGEEINLEETDMEFNAIMDGFMGKGGAGFFFLKDSPIVHQSEMSGAEIVERYFQRFGVVSPQVEGRLQIVK